MPRFASLLLILLTLIPAVSQSQDLSGTWEGNCGGTAITFVLVKCGDKYVGYNYDRDGLGFCRTNIEAVYNEATKKLKVFSKSFIDHSFGHSQTNYSLIWSGENYIQMLEGSAHAKGAIVKVLSLGLGIPATLRKTMAVPDTTAFMRTALEVYQNTRQTTAIVAVNTPADSTTTVTGKNIENNAEQPLLHATAERKNIIIQTISTSATNITVTVYDNGVQDGDSISIICDSTVIANRIAVSLQPVTFRVSLDDRPQGHQLVLFAHNLGSIPPNTAIVEITAGARKYTLTALSNLTSNAVIKFIKEAGD